MHSSLDGQCPTNVDNRDGNSDKEWMIAVMVGGEMPQQPLGSVSYQW